MTDSHSRKKTPRSPARRTRSRKMRRRFWLEATVRDDRIHLQAGAPTKWFRTLRWVVLILVMALVIRFLPDLWQAIQVAIQTAPK